MFKKIMKTFEKLFVAIAFAEEGEFDTAREILREKRDTYKKNKARTKKQSPNESLTCRGYPCILRN